MILEEPPPVRHERRSHSNAPLIAAEMNANPFVVFGEWFEAARAANIPEVNATSLATADAKGRVTCRTVLLKAWDERGFVFFTNYTSEKARQLEENPHAALLFPWLGMSRQVEITGRAERITTAESLAYFVKRPFKSQVGAWISEQSTMITSRALLEAKFQQMLHKFQEGRVPLPDHWGGYRDRTRFVRILAGWRAPPARPHPIQARLLRRLAAGAATAVESTVR